MARPKKAIDGKMVRALAQKFCSMREIGAVLGCDEATIRRRFSAEVAEGKEQGKTRLRDLQWRAAEHGSDRMLIHLGKNYLDQVDRQEVRMEVTDEQQHQRALSRRLDEFDRLVQSPTRGGGSGGNGHLGSGPVEGNGHGGNGKPA